MRNACTFAALLVSAFLAPAARGQSLIFRNFPHRSDLGIVCWSVADQRAGYLSQIVVYKTTRTGIPTVLWESSVDNSYSPQIRFVLEIRSDGVSIALVQRQTGAASSELQVVGKAAGHFAVLFHADGFKFDVASLDGSKLPFIIVHSDASILDVPDIFRWTGSRFVEDSRAHRSYYRDLLAQDRKTVRSDASAPFLINLSRIATLAGDRTAAQDLLRDAHAKGRRE